MYTLAREGEQLIDGWCFDTVFKATGKKYFNDCMKSKDHAPGFNKNWARYK